jgi:hypothetical protein
MNDIINLGSIRVSNQHVIQLKTYDPYAETGPTSYRITANEIWFPYAQYRVGEWVTYYDRSEPTYYNGAWNAATNNPQLSNNSAVLIDTYYIVSQGGTVNLGSGSITFIQGDLIAYDGSKWIKVDGTKQAYVCVEDHWAGSTFDNTKWIKNQIPPYYRLDSVTGVLHASLAYIPIYSETYEFYVRLDKRDQLTQQIGFTNQLFSLTIRGPVDNDLFFESSSQLGIINRGHLSEFSIITQHQYQSLGASIKLISGQLPLGLELAPDGSIFGRVVYTAPLGDYTFTVQARDQYNQIIEKTFTISVSEYDDDQFTQIFVKPFLKRATRNAYTQFISNTNIFQRDLLYRPSDPNFGIQYDIRLYLEYGIQQAELVEYAAPMKDYFYKKKLWFGSIETTEGRDSTGKHIYDVVYVNVVDPLVRTLPFQIVSGSGTYPNSIEHMRNAIETMNISGRPATRDEFLSPLWLRTPQANTGVPIGYKPVVVLCYCKPGSGASVIRNIQQSGFQFNIIDFEIDRLVVNENFTVQEIVARDNSIIIASDGSIIISRYDTKLAETGYLMFPQQTRSINNII